MQIYLDFFISQDKNCFWLSADGQGWIPFKICSILMHNVASKRGPNPATQSDNLNLTPIRSKYMEEFLSRQVKRATNNPNNNNNNSPIRSKYMEEFFSRQVRDANNPSTVS